jgi:hypothetical protein
VNEQPPRNGLYLEDKIKIIDWLRKIGQAGIDQTKMTLPEMAAKAAELVKKPVTVPNVKTILTSLHLKPAAGHNRNGGDLGDVLNRLDALEAACKTAGIWPV